MNLPLNVVAGILVVSSYVISIFKLKAYNKAIKKLTSTDRSLNYHGSVSPDPIKRLLRSSNHI